MRQSLRRESPSKERFLPFSTDWVLGALTGIEILVPRRVKILWRTRRPREPHEVKDKEAERKKETETSERAKRRKKIASVWENEKETERRKCGSTNGKIIYYSITHRRTPQWPMGKPRIPVSDASYLSLFLSLFPRS